VTDPLLMTMIYLLSWTAQRPVRLAGGLHADDKKTSMSTCDVSITASVVVVLVAHCRPVRYVQ